MVVVCLGTVRSLVGVLLHRVCGLSSLVALLYVSPLPTRSLHSPTAITQKLTDKGNGISRAIPSVRTYGDGSRTVKYGSRVCYFVQQACMVGLLMKLAKKF